jgi:predicted ATPase
MLLVLDNLEHPLEVAPEVSELLGACTNLKVLATSREPLGLRWEHVYVVPPLRLPDTRDLPFLEEVPAVRLLLERARAADASFALTQDNAATIATLCRRLDGLPLALELAGARMRALSPAMLLEHLDQQLDLLNGMRDAPARQQSLRAALNWSYRFLSDPERILLGQLGAFAGRWTLESAESICVSPGIPGHEV